MCVSLIIISCIDCVSIWYAFWMFISLKILGSVIKKLHFLIMDSKIIHTACMRVTVNVIVARVAVIERERNIIYIPKQPRINVIAQREFYIYSILNWGDRHCVEQIRMKPIVLYNLCDILTSRDLLRSCVY